MAIDEVTCELLQIEDSLTALRTILQEMGKEDPKAALLVGADAVAGVLGRIKNCITELDAISGV